MLPVEPKHPRRAVRLSDLKKYSKTEKEKTTGWLSLLSGYRQAYKAIPPTPSDRACKSMAEQRATSRKPAALDLCQSVPYESLVSSVAPIVQNLAKTPLKSTTESWTPNATSTAPSPIASQHQRLSQRRDQSVSNSPSTVPTSVTAYRKAEGEVSKHVVQVAQPTTLHKSVHLAHTPSKNYQVQNGPRQSHRQSGRMTRFGDFMRTSQGPSTSQSPLPRRQSRPQPTSAPSRLHRQAAKVERKECTACGAPNSPCTRYGDHGLWLCTACRSPRSSIELPPRRDSRFEPQKRRPLQEFSSGSVEYNSSTSVQEPRDCE